MGKAGDAPPFSGTSSFVDASQSRPCFGVEDRQAFSDLKPAVAKLWLRGGFPDSFLAASDADSFAYRQNFIATYLERDIPQFSPGRIPAATLERLWRMLAHGQGTLMNASALAASLSVSPPMATRYVDLLVDLLLVRRLPPFRTNTRKRLVKSPKAYVRDSGLVHALLGLEDARAVAGHPVAGASWEGFVIDNLLAAAPRRTAASFYRTYAGTDRYPLSEKVEAVGLRELAGMFRAL